MLGCDAAGLVACTNPGGIGADRTGTAPLPAGSTPATPVLGTKNGDAAIVEKYSEEGATLLKNDGAALPLTRVRPRRRRSSSPAPSANHTSPTRPTRPRRASIDRDAVNPLQQLKEFSGKPGAFKFAPANDPTGYPVPSIGAVALATRPPPATSPAPGPGAGNDSSLDFTSRRRPRASSPRAATRGRGYVYVPDRRHVHVRASSRARASPPPT